MKIFSALRFVGLGLATAGAITATQTVSAKEFAGGEIAASAAVSNIYLFRGIDQSSSITGSGSGSGAISGDINYSHSGAYAGVWATSGFAGTNETDVYLGYGIELDSGLSVDLNVTSYVYAGNDSGPSFIMNGGADQVADFSEVILTVGYSTDDISGSVLYADNVSGDTGYTYLAFSAEFGDISATLGIHDPEEAALQTFDNDITHLDVTYSYNDNLSFTLSKVVAVDDEINVNNTTEYVGGSWIDVDDDTLFVVSYSLPIE